MLIRLKAKQQYDQYSVPTLYSYSSSLCRCYDVYEAIISELVILGWTIIVNYNHVFSHRLVATSSLVFALNVSYNL